MEISVHQYNNLHPEGHWNGNLGSCWYHSQDRSDIGHHWNRHRLLSGKEMKTYNNRIQYQCMLKIYFYKIMDVQQSDVNVVPLQTET